MLTAHATFLHWGVIQISLANFVVIVVMVVVFVAALLLPFPHGHDDDAPSVAPTEPSREH